MPRQSSASLLVLACLCALAGPSTALAHPGPHHRLAGKGRHAHHLRPGRGQRPGAGVHACDGAGLIPLRGDLGRIRAAVLCLVNRERARHGERPLRVNLRLQRAAQGHTRSMAFGDYFNHVGPRGETPLSRVRAAGYLRGARSGFVVGENIAWGTGRFATPRAIVAGWMASPLHRANILNPRFRDSAVGISPHVPGAFSAGGRGGVYTEDFGTVVR